LTACTHSRGAVDCAGEVSASALGDAYRVERWGYPFFSRVGGYLGFGYGMAGSMAGRSCGCK